uniref:type IV pilus modification PilV family protein n=1 Tax=Ningiella ruwaisensis TaxID=2364274 RepID=UPI00109F1DA1|nr:prepilin-type N-terminal cleavage/methylation domain-containing protein [Ningiella ruwaisensis]
MNVKSSLWARLTLTKRHQCGFTLIELIIGILLFAIAMVALANVFIPQLKRGIDPIWQTRAVTLAQSLSNEIHAKAFDENAYSLAESQACGLSVACTTSGALGPDIGENRSSFDDVDDFHGFSTSGSDIASSLGTSASFAGVDVYEGFSAHVSVFYDDNADGVNDDDADQDGNLDSATLIGTKKLIQIRIDTPAGESLWFSMFRENY